ncbi:MAG TPA: HD domain-containing protein [Candidatus Paceibacterota bacterium]|nr:HD domain-containing protein [Candidatus Paceibacterota bacterium]
MIDLAIEFATKKFQAAGQKNHFMRVLAVLRDEFQIDEELFVAAVLHDTLEDTDTTYEELETIFSKPVADLVAEVSHPKNYNKEQKIEFYKKLRTITPRAKILKLADFVDNLRSEIRLRKENPKSPYHNQYVLLIRELLESYPESNAKNIVLQLAKELETYVTK